MHTAAVRSPWGPKAQRTFSLSLEAWEQVTTMATESGVARTEVLEVLIRFARDQELPLGTIRAELLR